MRKYNWTLTVDVLNEEDIISNILSKGFICHGITKFSDLKGEKAGLPMYLREQASYLETFLEVVISCSGRKNSEEKWKELLPENLSMILNYVWRCFDTKTKALMDQRFTSPYGFLSSIFKDEENLPRIRRYRVERSSCLQIGRIQCLGFSQNLLQLFPRLCLFLKIHQQGSRKPSCRMEKS